MPFLGYSGRGRSQRGGRGGGGRGRGGRGRGRGGGEFRATNKHRWVRPVTREINVVVNEDHDDVGKPKTTLKNIENNSITTTGIVVSGSNSSNNTEDLTASKYVIMKKNGHNQLILSSKTRSVAIAAVAASTARLSDESQPITSHTLTREGNHKLISTSNKNKNKPTIVPKRKQPINHSNNSYPNSFRYQKSNGGGGGGGRGVGVKNNANLISSSTSRCPAAKRVKLPPGNTNTDGNIGNEKSNKDPSDMEKIKDLDVVALGEELKSQPDDDKVTVRPKRTEKLTDFAYRETSTVRQRAAVKTSHNLHWSKKNNESSNTSDVTCSTGSNNSKAANKQSTIYNKRKNMGLVRIQLNEENTPICSTFLRGIPCQNQYCRKRHDVPKEYAVPICSFFQRHGQCMKGESCVFRHIRNPQCSYCQKRHDPSKEFCSYFTKT
jgi:hypothetical protein